MTRSTLATLLISLREQYEKTPLEIIEDALDSNDPLQQINLSPLLIKISKLKPETAGLSINEIANLGNLLEYAMVTSTAIQNWVKRDIKELIGAPMHGKKYSIDQAAILFIVEDLKVVLDFESIRKALTMVFNNPADRSDDIIDPVYFYKGYADIFCHLYKQDLNDQLEKRIEAKVQQFILSLNIDPIHHEKVKKLLSISVLSIFSSCFHSKAKSLMQKTILES
ncbi:DUF1836 domain-containing protein [Litchfieldia salsa]